MKTSQTIHENLTKNQWRFGKECLNTFKIKVPEGYYGEDIYKHKKINQTEFKIVEDNGNKLKDEYPYEDAPDSFIE